MTAPDPDYVNAVVRGDVPGRTTANVTIFCDRCGVELNGDYIVGAEDDRSTRFAYARAYVRTQLGWTGEGIDDFCPDCSKPVTPEARARLADRVRGAFGGRHPDDPSQPWQGVLS